MDGASQVLAEGLESAEPRRKLSPPFSSTTSLIQTENPAPSILPAVFRDAQNDLVRLAEKGPTAFALMDMDVSMLNKLHQYLWLAGRPTCARALNQQKMIERQIVITEQAGMHLVWHESRMFLKPLPDYLLDYQF